MKRLKYLLFILLFFCCLNVKAITECTSDEMKRLHELANNVEIKYEYKVQEELEEDTNILIKRYYAYKIDLLNFSKDLKMYLDGDIEDGLLSLEELKGYTFYDGEPVSFHIYSHTPNMCTNKLLKILEIKLPYYNQYYYDNKEKCLKYPDFEYCKETLVKKTTLSSQEIDKLFDSYLKEDNTDNNSNNIINYININYIIIFIIGSILLCIIIIIIKRRNKDRDLKR